MPAPGSFAGKTSRRVNDKEDHVYLSNISGQWHLDAGEAGSSVWATPPKALGRLVTELFIAQPDDVLTWVNLAVWRMHEEELLKYKGVRSSFASRSQVFPDSRPKSVTAARTSARVVGLQHLEERPVQERAGSAGSSSSSLDIASPGVSVASPWLLQQGGADLVIPCLSTVEERQEEEQNDTESSTNDVEIIAGSMPLSAITKSQSLQSREALTTSEGGIGKQEALSTLESMSGSDISNEEIPRPVLRQWPQSRPASGPASRKSPELIKLPELCAKLRGEDLPETHSASHSAKQLSPAASSHSLNSASNFTMAEDDLRSRTRDGFLGESSSREPSSPSLSGSSTGHDYVSQRYTKNDRKISFAEHDMKMLTQQMRGLSTVSTSARNTNKTSRVDARLSQYTEADAAEDDWMLHFIDERVPWRKAEFGSRKSRDALNFDEKTTLKSDGLDSRGSAQSFCAMHPACMARLLWDFVFLLAFLLEVWAVPFELVFLPEQGNLPVWLDKLSLVLLIFFCSDIVLNFLTGYVTKGQVVLKLRRVAFHYLQYGFFLDVVATMPEVVCRAKEKRHSLFKLFKFVRILRMVRIYNWESYITRLAIGVTLKTRKLVILLVKLHLLVILLAHFHAVAVASMQPRASWITHPNEGLLRYLEYHWRAQVALTFGSDYELLEEARSLNEVPSSGQSVLGIITAGARFGLLWMTLLRLLLYASMHEAEEIEHEMMEHYVQQYLIDRRIAYPIQLEILQNVQEVAKMEKCKHFVSAYASQEHLKLYLRIAVSENLWMERLMHLGLVRELVEENKHFAQELAMSVQHEVWSPRTVLYSAGEKSDSAYHILRGSMRVQMPFQPTSPNNPAQAAPADITHVSDVGTISHHLTDQSKAPKDFGPGMWVGEKALINPELRRSESVLCIVWAELMMVPAVEFRKLVVYYELQDVFEELIQNKLWLGLCGRCGMFGDHFAKNCPHDYEASGVFSRAWERTKRHSSLFRFHRSSSLSMDARRSGETNALAKDLERFLLDNDLARMIKVMERYGIHRLDDINKKVIAKIAADPEVGMKPEEAELFSVTKVKDFKKRLLRGATKILATTGKSDNHLVFLSHYKWNAGTEAALIQKDMERLIAEDPGNPGHDLTSPIFVDTEDLRDLNDLQTHVRKSHNLVLLLTVGVLERPWVLIEIVTAIKTGVRVVPVEIQRPGTSFTYPDEEYYQRLAKGQELDAATTDMLSQNGIQMTELAKAVRQTFKKIALPFSPHKTANVRQAELTDILRQCTLRTTPMNEGTL